LSIHPDTRERKLACKIRKSIVRTNSGIWDMTMVKVKWQDRLIKTKWWKGWKWFLSF
jgi:hypothetical protein